MHQFTALVPCIAVFLCMFTSTGDKDNEPPGYRKNGGSREDKPKRFAGRNSLRLPAPTPEEIRQTRLRANLSQGQACDLTGIKEVMTWSNYERRKKDGTPKARIDPIKWEYFLLKTGQHPGFALIPRLGAAMPKEVTALRRRGPSLPDKDVTFAIEELKRREWRPLIGRQFSTMTCACVAAEVMDIVSKLGKRRLRRYLDGEPDQVVSTLAKRGNKPVPPHFALRDARKKLALATKHRPSCARCGWKR